MPDIDFSRPHSTLRSYAPRMLIYNDTLINFERRLAMEQSVVVMLPPEDTRKEAYKQKIATLDIAKAKLGGLVDFETKILEKQIKRPNMALSLSAETVNEQLEKGLREVEDALVEMLCLM